MSGEFSTNGNSSHTDFTTLTGGSVVMADHIGSELSVRFDRGPSAASAARNALLALDERLDGKTLDDIRLLVSELVTNAIRHAEAEGGTVELNVTIDRGRVRVEVADPGAGFEPQPRDDEMNRPGGWGLYLVDRIADRWGVVRNRMNRVWFELDAGRSPSARLN
jgi:anti-sigma regulatory factor (Ser/Thr protein kinase)